MIRIHITRGTEPYFGLKIVLHNGVPVLLCAAVVVKAGREEKIYGYI